MPANTDRLQPLSLRQLLHWIKAEYEQHGSLFGIPSSRFSHTVGNWSWAGNRCALPLGPAAGPHTQLTQNILTAYLCGGRFFELKTVQQLDALVIEKPCIDADDEGYNSEWSTELSLQLAREEYTKAWLLLPLLQELLQPGGSLEPDYIFNISVGYDLAGIQSPAVDRFIQQMQDAAGEPMFEQMRDTILEELKLFVDWGQLDNARLLERIRGVDSCVTRSVTLSTMHGCSPAEIEAIALYLLQEKQLDTVIKLNPTLLGEERVRELLQSCGYGYLELSPQTFTADLDFAGGLDLLKRLQEQAALARRFFGVKLSNTLPVGNTLRRLPGREVYLSGRALYPLTVNLAASLAAAFDGALPLSFSGGATALNLASLLRCGIQPVTVVTDLLKPGGYLRLADMAIVAQEALQDRLPSQVDPAAVAQLAAAATGERLLQKSLREDSNPRFKTALPSFDCLITPCREACPIQQDVPGYLRLMEQKRLVEALSLILDHNPLPHITGYICDHQCMSACTRQFYEEPLLIRDIKRLAAAGGSNSLLSQLATPLKRGSTPVAIIGAGPAGLAAAAFLRRAGIPVTLFEQREAAGGMVQHVIPAFRLPASAIRQDIDLLTALGVEFVFNAGAEFNLTQILAEGYNQVVLALGATRGRLLELPGEALPVLDAVEFLTACHAEEPPGEVRGRVVVVGGGNTAMDSARVACRLPAVTTVTIVYRRTEAQMPADREEYHAARKDGVSWRELLAPVASWAETLVCQPQRLLEVGEDGRQRVGPAEAEEVLLACDTVIAAIGEVVDPTVLKANAVALTANDTIQVAPDTLATSRAQVYAAGDARRGPATVVEAIADGRKVAESILAEQGVSLPFFPPAAVKAFPEPLTELYHRRGHLQQAAAQPLTVSDSVQEARRCLACDQLCNRCVDVCPNRANIALDLEWAANFRDRFQILHLEGLCNECGNCVTFCPHEGAPWRDKPTLFSDEAAFNASTTPGFLLLEDRPESHRRYRIRLDELLEEITLQHDGSVMEPGVVAILGELPGGKQLLQLLQLLHSSYDYLLPG